MAVAAADLDRLYELAAELQAAGREADAALLARVASGASARGRVRLPVDELERVLEQGEADIAAGRFVSDDELWARLDTARATDQRE